MIRVEKVSKAFGKGRKKVVVLENLNFHIKKSEIVTILGRSGSGKTTLLDLIMDLDKPTSGEIHRTKENLSIGYVFQRPTLLPWRNLSRNVALPLEIAKVNRKERKIMVKQALSQLGLEYASSYFPHQLSGGMAQRAAIARAIVQDPDILLMDEPFSALDPILRDNLNINLHKFQGRTGKTILFVTHSINEAVILSNRIVILEEGAFVKEFKIDLPDRRDFETFHTPEFAKIAREIREHLPIQPNIPQRQGT